MKKKFKIMYGENHPNHELRGKPYKPPQNCMVVMNGGGVFFLYDDETYYPSIQRLSEVLSCYDVVWK
jgi:hypothetical protein